MRFMGIFDIQRIDGVPINYGYICHGKTFDIQVIDGVPINYGYICHCE